MNCNPIRVTAAVLACVVLLTAWSGQGGAQGTAADTARDVVDRVLRDAEKTRGGDLDAWSRSVIERALERAGRKASGASAPLPAEDHARRVAGGLSARPHGPEVIVFMSLSAPAASWRQWSREAARIGAALVLRGLGPDGFQATVKRIGPYLDREGGAAIDPRLFRLFGIHGDSGRRGGAGRGPALRKPGLRRGPRTAPRPHRGEHRSGRGAGGHGRRGRTGPRGRAPPSRKPERGPAMKLWQQNEGRHIDPACSNLPRCRPRFGRRSRGGGPRDRPGGQGGSERHREGCEFPPPMCRVTSERACPNGA